MEYILNEVKVEVNLERLAVRMKITTPRAVLSEVESMFYIRGHFDETPSLCRHSTEEFYRLFLTDLGASHVKLQGHELLVCSYKESENYIKIFVNNEGVLGILNICKDIFTLPQIFPIM